MSLLHSVDANTAFLHPDGDALDRAARAFRDQGFEAGFEPPGHDTDAPLAYGCHPLYYTLASRGAGAALRSAAGGFALMPVASPVVLPKTGSRLCVLRPHILDAEGFWPALREVSLDTGIALVVKSVDVQESETAVGRYGARHYAEGERWSDAARWDDQTFPEVVLDLTRPGSASRESPDTFFERYAGGRAAEIGREVADKWLTWYLSRRFEFGRSEIRAYYDNALSESNVSRADDVFVGWYQGEPVAFAYGSRISALQVDLWVSLCGREPPLLGRCFLDFIRSTLAASGLRYLGLGGSELRSLFHFKRRLGGRLLLRRTHLVIGG